MAKTANPKFISDYDCQYHNDVKRIFLANQGVQGGLTQEGLLQYRGLNASYDLTKVSPVPLEFDDERWQRFAAYEIEWHLHDRKLYHGLCLPHNILAQDLFCWRLCNQAWYYDRGRRQHILQRFEQENWDNCEVEIAEIAMAGTRNYQTFPTFRNIEHWLENYDLPSIDQIDLESDWHTLQEWVTISRHNPNLELPLTIKQMRHFVNHLEKFPISKLCTVSTQEKGYFRRKIGGTLMYKFQ